MGYARYIGRVGALAIALGIGAAVATTPQTGWATPNPDGSTEAVDDTQTSTANHTGATTPEPVSSADPSPPPPVSQTSTDPVPAYPEGETSSQSTVTDGATTVSASGGSNTTVGEGTASETEIDTTERTEPTAENTPDAQPPAVEPSVLPRVNNGGSHDGATPTTPDPVVPAVGTTAEVSTQLRQAVTDAAATFTSSRTAFTHATSIPTVQNGSDTTTLTTPGDSNTPTSAVVQAVQLVTSVLSPLLSPSPENPAAPAVMWAVMAWVRREIDPAGAPQALTVTTTAETAPEEDAGARMALVAATDDTSSVMALPPGASVELANTGSATTAAPSGVSLSPDGIRAYVTNNAAGTVTVIDTATNTSVGAPITVGTNPTEVVLNSDGSRLYVANRGSNSVSVINTANNTVVKTIAVGTSPDHLALSPDGSRLLVSNSGSGTVSKINTSTNTLAIAVGIKVGFNPAGIAFSPDGKYAYVANTGSDTVSVITMATNQVKTLNGVGDNPTDVVVNPDTGIGYVTTLDGSIGVIDTATNTVTGSITTGKNSSAAALSPDGDILVTANTDDSVTAIDTATGSVIMSLPTDPNAEAGSPAIAYHPGGGAVYVTDAVDNVLRTISVSVVNTPNTAPVAGVHIIGAPDFATGTVTGTVVGVDADEDPLTYTLAGASGGANVTIDAETGQFSYTPTTVQRLAADNTPDPTGTFFVSISDGRTSTTVPVTVSISPLALTNSTTTTTGGSPAGVVLSPDGSRAYVTNRAAGTVTVIDTATGAQVGAPIPVGVNPTEAVLNSTGTRLYVANRGSNSVSVIDTADNSPVKTINVGINPEHLAISPDGSRLLVSNAGSGTVTKINTVTNQISTSGIKVGTNPGGLAFSPDGKYAYVANTGSDTVSVITMSTNSVKTITGVGDGPTSITVNPATGRGYITTLDGKVTVLDTATNTVAGSINTGKDATDAALSPDGTILVTANTDDSVTAIDTATGSVINGVQTDLSPEAGAPAIAFHPDNATIFVTDAQDNVLRRVVLQPSNGTPVVDPEQPFTITDTDPDTGIVTGVVNVSDPNGDTITYTGTADTPKGSVLVNPDGTFTYIPTDDAQHDAAAGGPAAQDSFVVTATDSQGSSIDIPVTVDVNPVNRDPVNGIFTAGEPGPGGVVTGTASAQDADEDNVTYSATTDPTKGSVEVGEDGSFTYTPTAEAQHAAAAGGAAAQDSFVVTADDGHGGTLDIPVTVAVNPENEEPTNNTATVAATDPNTGVVTGTINSTDADDDELVYTVTAAPTKGDVVVAPDGTFTYTPDEEQRDAALPTPGPDLDSFTVAVSDGHGASAAIPVSVTVTPSVVETFALSAEASPQWVAFNADGSKAYVVNQGNGTVSIIDTATKATIVDVATGSLPTHVDRAPNGKIYVTNQGSGTVTVINPDTNVVTDTITVGGNPLLVTFSDEGLGYVATGAAGNSVVVFDTATDDVVDTYTVGTGGRPAMARVTPDGDKLYVTNQLAGTLTVIDVDSKNVLKVIPLGNHPTVIEFNETGDRAYVTVEFDNNVAVIDTSTDTHIGDIPTGPAGVQTPIGLQIKGDRAYAVNFAGLGPTAENPGSVGVLDLTTNTLIGVIPVGDGPVGGTITPNGQELWVVKQTGSISIIPLFEQANTAPVITTLSGPNIDGTTNTATGSLHVTDADGDGLSYVSTPPPGVQFTPVVTGNPAGGHTYSYTYTPTDEARHAAAAVNASPSQLQDTITLTVFDSYGNVTTTQINVPLIPTNEIPTVTHNPDEYLVRRSTGEYYGSVVGADADFDTLQYSASAPAKGIVVVNSNGEFTYTPYAAARLAAAQVNAPAEDKQDSFTITVDDGHGGTDSVDITVTVTPPHNQVIASIPMAESGGQVVVSPDGTRIYATNSQGMTLNVIDAESRAVLKTIPLGAPQPPNTGYVDFVATNADGTKVYVSNYFGSSVSVVDPVTETVTIIPLPYQPRSLTSSPDGNFIYVAGYTANKVTVIDTSDDSMTAFTVTGYPQTIAVSPTEPTIYVGQALWKVSVVDADNNAIVGSIDLQQQQPVDIVVSPDGSRVYVGLSRSGADEPGMAIIDTSDNSVSFVDFGAQLGDMAITADGSTLYISPRDGSSMLVVDTATNTVADTVPLVRGAFNIDMSADGTLIYARVAGINSGSVAVISIVPATEHTID